MSKTALALTSRFPPNVVLWSCSIVNPVITAAAPFGVVLSSNLEPADESSKFSVATVLNALPRTNPVAP